MLMEAVNKDVIHVTRSKLSTILLRPSEEGRRQWIKATQKCRSRISMGQIVSSIQLFCHVVELFKIDWLKYDFRHH